MSFLRMGTACAVFDDAGRVLLSRRGDMDVWNLPTGRLDSGEILADAATREAREETGLIVGIDRPVGLYYFQATQRLNVLYTGFPIGGGVLKRTDEAKDNRYFALDALPESLFAPYMAHDAAQNAKKALHIHTTPLWERWMLRMKLGRRWLFNLLRGQPEPRHVRFDVCAVAVIWNPAHRRVLTMPGRHEQVLPFIHCDGQRAPWQELQRGIRRWFNVQPQLHWVGMWLHPSANEIEFVFAATLEETQLSPQFEWTSAQNGALLGRDAQYVERTYPQERVWTIIEREQATTTITRRA